MARIVHVDSAAHGTGPARRLADTVGGVEAQVGPAEAQALARVPWRLPQTLIYAGLFLASSDRFLSLDFSGLTLKPSYVLFSAALVFVVLHHGLRPMERIGSPFPGFLLSVGLLLGVNVVAALLAVSKVLAAEQLVTIVGGALLPFACVALGLRTRVQCDRAASALVAGTLAAATFGFYQFVAPYFGLPQGLPYTGVIGEVGRISAWAYEPAFYVFHLEMTLAIVLGDVLVGRRRLGVRPEVLALFLLASLVLANTRVAFLSLPLLVVLVLRTSGERRRLDRRAIRVIRVGAAGVALTVVLGLPLGVNLPAYVVERVQSVTDLDEAQSNAIRVHLYQTEVELVGDRPWLGYGPGNIGLLLVERIPIYRGLDPHVVVANNLVLQTLLDAGYLSLPFAVAVVFFVYRDSRRSSSRDARILLSGATAVLLVNAMLVSFFWDMRLWVVLGLAYAYARVDARELASARSSTSGQSPAVKGESYVSALHAAGEASG